MSASSGATETWQWSKGKQPTKATDAKKAKSKGKLAPGEKKRLRKAAIMKKRVERAASKSSKASIASLNFDLRELSDKMSNLSVDVGEENLDCAIKPVLETCPLNKFTRSIVYKLARAHGLTTDSAHLSGGSKAREPIMIYAASNAETGRVVKKEVVERILEQWDAAAQNRGNLVAESRQVENRERWAAKREAQREVERLSSRKIRSKAKRDAKQWLHEVDQINNVASSPLNGTLSSTPWVVVPTNTTVTGIGYLCSSSENGLQRDVVAAAECTVGVSVGASWVQHTTGFGLRMLQSLGWDEKSGLGKDGKGIKQALDPLELRKPRSLQKSLE